MTTATLMLMSQCSSASLTYQAAAISRRSYAGETARGKPPPDCLDRLVWQSMLALFAVAFLRVFGWDLLRLVAWVIG